MQEQIEVTIKLWVDAGRRPPCVLPELDRAESLLVASVLQEHGCDCVPLPLPKVRFVESIEA